MEERDKKLELARKLQRLLDGSGSTDSERETASALLKKLQETYGFTDEELAPVDQPIDDLADDTPIEEAFDLEAILSQFGVTKEQLKGFLGDLAIRGLTKVLDVALTGGKKRK